MLFDKRLWTIKIINLNNNPLLLIGLEAMLSEMAFQKSDLIFNLFLFFKWQGWANLQKSMNCINVILTNSIVILPFEVHFSFPQNSWLLSPSPCQWHIWQFDHALAFVLTRPQFYDSIVGLFKKARKKEEVWQLAFLTAHKIVLTIRYLFPFILDLLETQGDSFQFLLVSLLIRRLQMK